MRSLRLFTIFIKTHELTELPLKEHLDGSGRTVALLGDDQVGDILLVGFGIILVFPV